MNTSSDLIHPDEARAIVLDKVNTLGAERVELARIAGRIVAHDVVARDDHPPFPASTMDGYAISSQDLSPWREITGVQIAGPDAGLEVFDGQTIKIMTGAPLPNGADAVVQIEHVEVSDGHIVMPDYDIRPGLNIRPVGSDLGRGETIVAAGTKIGAIELGLIATMGYPEIDVARRPRVAVISTGDELVEPGTDLAPGMIRDSNRYSLMEAALEAGAEIVHSSKVGDDIAELRALVASLEGRIDALITSGGVSVGDRDVVRMLLGETAEVHFRRVFMKPGKPLTFATSADLMIFGLPGNPVSSLVSMELFVRPALLAMQGATTTMRTTGPVLLQADVTRSDRLEFQRAHVRFGEDGRLVANTTGNQISSRLVSMLNANALLVIEAGDEVIPAGSTVQALLLDTPGNI